jgi:DNA segregation ATPase FtsK/SpoIIIE, S-DNA-T family
MALNQPYRFDDGPHRARPRPLLPSAMSNSLWDGARRIWGALLVVSLGLAWLSLLSWSVSDPSLFHATTAPIRNWLGRPGALVSDLLVQALGLTCIVMVIAPMQWAVTLLCNERIPRLMPRMASHVGAALILAAAASGLTVVAGWPLPQGYGGIVGDAIYRALAPPARALSPELGSIAVAVMMAVIGWSLFAFSLGATARQIVAHVRTRWFGQRSPRSERRVEPPLYSDGHTVAPPISEPTLAWARPNLDQTQRQAASRGTEPAARAVGVAATYQAYAHDEFAADDDELAPFEAAIPQYVAPSRQSPAHQVPILHPTDRASDPEFDAFTEAASSGMAARFAPANALEVPFNAPRFYQDTLSTTYGNPANHQREWADHEPALDTSSEPPFLAPIPTSRALVKTQTYRRPSLNHLERPLTPKSASNFVGNMLRGNARLLEDTLADFGITGEVKDIKPGPVVTLYELEPARGTKAARVIALAPDIARAMGVTSARIAIIPGRGVLGIELPNQVRETVYLRDIFDSEQWRSTMDILPVALGRSITGEPIVADLTRMPHMLVAGTTGSGKSVGINAMILSLIYKHGPEDCRLLMIDPKMLELSVYNGIPHLLTPVVTDPHKAITALAWCVTEMEERYKRMASLGVRNIDVFNNRVRNAKKRGERLARTVQTGFDKHTGEATYVKEEMTLDPMPYIVIVVDEFADLMAVAGKEIEASVARLAQMARAAGIHLIMATQRPTVDIVTGAIKANMPARVSYKVASKIDSRTILGGEGAETLLGNGDLLYSSGTGEPVRVHGPFVTDEEVESIAESLRQQGAPNYIPGLTDEPRTSAAAKPARSRKGATANKPKSPAMSDDALYDRAVAIVVRDRRASLTHLQRRLDITPAWAASLMARLEADGVITDANASGHHTILVGHPPSREDAA